MFSRDIKHYQYRAPRTLQSSKFGPYAQLSTPSVRRRFAATFWVVTYGIGIGAVWYVAFVIGVSR